ncbi:hypothetical protein KY359_06425 [Candidatus Woesearchaeota archaeon]|nr:hypothetical protein [Candidatus Woesearchaeota archaeon]
MEEANDSGAGKATPQPSRNQISEPGFAEKIDWILEGSEGRKLYYMGAVNGVDDAFNYVSNLAPEHAFMLSTREEPLWHLSYRLCLLMGADNMRDYFLDMLCSRGDDGGDAAGLWADNDPDDIIKRIIRYDPAPGRSFEQGKQFLEWFGLSTDDPRLSERTRTIFFDPMFKKRDALDGVSYLAGAIEREDFPRSWLFFRNYQTLKRMAGDGRIQGVALSSPAQLVELAPKMVHEHGIENLVLNISDLYPGEESEHLGYIYQALTDTRVIKKMWILER